MGWGRATIWTLVAAVAVAALLVPAAAHAGSGFDLGKTKIAPKQALFDGKKRLTLRYGFKAKEPIDLSIRVIDRDKRKTVARWVARDAQPGKRAKRRWNGVNRRGKAAGDGRYEFRLGPKGGREVYAGSFRLRGHVYPVDGPHGDRGGVGQFGAGRNGGRVHEGYDIIADCGTPLVAARGGKVVAAGFDPRLYGYFVRINARKSDEQYFYSHLISASPFRKGDRIRTGERLGDVGQTGNAASTPCHLHFELRKGGGLVDPRPFVESWE